MGGYGALHLGMKHPTLFGAISSVAPAILHDLKDEPRERTFDTFGDDEAYSTRTALVARAGERGRSAAGMRDPSPVR